MLGCTISEAHLNGSPYRTYTYTPLNLLQSTTEASTNLTTKNAFDDNGRLVRLYSASDSTTEYYGYDDLGRQIWQKSSSDVYSTSFSYDNPDYPWLSTGFTSGSSSKTLSVGSTRFKVDKVTHRVLESNKVTFYSDNTKNNFTKIHTYDSAGRLLNTTMTSYPDGYVELTLYTYYGKTVRQTSSLFSFLVLNSTYPLLRVALLQELKLPLTRGLTPLLLPSFGMIPAQDPPECGIRMVQHLLRTGPFFTIQHVELAPSFIQH